MAFPAPTTSTALLNSASYAKMSSKTLPPHSAPSCGYCLESQRIDWGMHQRVEYLAQAQAGRGVFFDKYREELLEVLGIDSGHNDS